MKFKNGLVQLLGIITTALSIGMIYLILFKDGYLQKVSASMLIEFLTVIFIAVSTRFFWYTSTESFIRTSEQYLEKRSIVLTAINENITDAKDFDDFVEMENEENYNKYISNRCKNMTVKNYKLSFVDCIHKLFYHKDRLWYMTRYMLAVERRANRQHKLSGANIRALAQSSDGLTDDRNKADAKKITFLWSGALFSFISMLFTAAVAFDNKSDIDMKYAILKMIMYVAQILFSILQAVLKARSTVAREDLSYFNRILSIISKYEAYKVKPYTVEKVSYIPMEVNDGINSKEINVTIGE